MDSEREDDCVGMMVGEWHGACLPAIAMLKSCRLIGMQLVQWGGMSRTSWILVYIELYCQSENRAILLVVVVVQWRSVDLAFEYQGN